MSTTDTRIRQAAPLDSTTWTCAGCSGIFGGQLPADTTCRDCRAPGASWKTPRVLAKALGKWAARDDTRPDPKARAAAGDALAAIDATIAELAALRARLVREMDWDAPVTAGIACGADWGSATESQRCTLSDGHDGLHADQAGYKWGPGQTPHRAAAAYIEDQPLVIVPLVDCDEPPAEAVSLASCGHPRDDDGECNCAWWPERAPVSSPEDLAAGDDGEDLVYVRPPVTAPLMTVVSAAGLVGDLDEDDERPAAYMACGDQLATGEPEDQGPADCPRHGPTRFITLDAWMDAATALPPGGLYELVFRFAESDRWTDEELAALPPMFPPVPPRVGPWPYARAA